MTGSISRFHVRDLATVMKNHLGDGVTHRPVGDQGVLLVQVLDSARPFSRGRMQPWSGRRGLVGNRGLA